MSMIYPTLTGEMLSDFVRAVYYFAVFLTVFNIAFLSYAGQAVSNSSRRGSGCHATTNQQKQTR
jgi:hypothetical protein